MQSPNPSKPTSSETVRSFFSAFGRGDLPALVALFHPNAKVVAVRSGSRKPGQLHGSYTGHPGVTEFIGNIGQAFETLAFAVEHVVGEGNAAFASGSFSHRVKTTGKIFNSEWALKCLVQEGRIVDYHFYEDSAALVTADPSAAL